MANERPVHVLPRKGRWAVVREGNERATSIHRTQAEAAKAGREIARKDAAEFLLHAKDGRVRDRSDYGGDPSSPKEKPESPVAGVASAATQATGGAIGLASGVVGGAVEGLGRAEEGPMTAAEDRAEDRADETPGEGSDDTGDAGGLAREERYAGYEVYDQLGKSFGEVDIVFLDEEDELEYVGVKTGLPGTGSAFIIPAEVVTIDEGQGRMVVERSDNVVERGPALMDEEEATPEFEERVRLHYGLDRAARSGTYGAYHAGPPEGGTGVGTSETEGTSTSASSGAPGEEEIKVRRIEEELVAGTREREAGEVRVRKRVRTDREQIEVPTRHEEVSVERVPLSGEAATEIGEDEVEVPVTEEEVVVEKRPVVKEEVRIKKDVVEDTEVVEEEVRREEIDIDDETTTRRDI